MKNVIYYSFLFFSLMFIGCSTESSIEEVMQIDNEITSVRDECPDEAPAGVFISGPSEVCLSKDGKFCVQNIDPTAHVEWNLAVPNILSDNDFCINPNFINPTKKLIIIATVTMGDLQFCLSKAIEIKSC